MPITGGLKIFETNKNLFADGATILASSGDATSNFAIDKNRITRWRSSGSADTITETLTVTFPSSKTINRILLVDHNWKEFTVKYDVAGTPTDFTTVIGIDGVLGGGITETTFADTTAYYEFDSVTTTGITITATKTQVVDAEKFLNLIISTLELGTLQGFPRIRKLEHSRNLRSKKVLSGKKLIEPSEQSFSCRLQFRNYPRSLSADIILMFNLFHRDDPFILWISGGRRGSAFHGINGFQLEGYRLQDTYQVFFERAIQPLYSKNVYSNSLNFQINLHEVI